MRRSSRLSVLAALALWLAASPQAFGHKMIAASRVHEDGTVLVQAFFPDGKPAQNVKADVLRPDGSTFLTGETDQEGKLRVEPDTQGQWTVVFTGSMGHQTKCTFTMAPSGEPAPVSQEPAVSDAQGKPEPVHHEESLAAPEPFPWSNVLSGLGFVFGLSAFIMCLRLRADLRRINTH